MSNSRLNFGKNKYSKILFSLILSIMLVGLASAQDDGPSPGGDTAAQEFQLEGQSWNNIAVNVDSISLSEADGDCSFDYEPYSAGGVSGYAWTVNPETGNWEALGTDEELSTTQGYSIWVPESCRLVLEGNTASEVYERDLAGESWNLITLPEGRSPSDLEERIESTDGVSIGDWQGEKYWTNMGGEWDHPYNSLDNDRPFYVWVNSETTVDFGESVEDPGPGGDPDDGSDDSDDSDDGVDESPSDCAEDEYYDHGFNMCLPDSDSGDDSDDGSDDSGDDSEIEFDQGTGEIQAQDIRNKAGGALSIDSASYSNGRIDVTGGIHTKAQFSLYTADDVPTVSLMVNGQEVDSVRKCQRMTATAYGGLDRKFDFSLSADRTLDSTDEVSVDVDHHFIRVQLGNGCGSGRDTVEMDYSYELTG
jgi:hypothetical protein